MKEAYGNLLTGNAYPLFVLFINVPHEMVDVNVHPRKEQIAFMNSDIIMTGIKKIIQKTISDTDLTYSAPLWEKRKSDNMPAHATSILRDAVEPWGIKKHPDIMKYSDIIQVHNVYLVGQTFTGVAVIDQHAAHERILFEQFFTAFRQKKERSLSVPVRDAIIINTPPEISGSKSVCRLPEALS